MRSVKISSEEACARSSPTRTIAGSSIPSIEKRYRDRNAIERMFCRLKDFRRIATRYDKLARNYLASLCLAALVSC